MSIIIDSLGYLAPLALAVLALLKESDVQKNRKRKALTILVFLSLLITWGSMFLTNRTHGLQIAQQQTSAAANEKSLSDGFAQQKQALLDKARDLEERLANLETRDNLIAQGCIANPKLRQQAKSIHNHFQRSIQEDAIKIGDSTSAHTP